MGYTLPRCEKQEQQSCPLAPGSLTLLGVHCTLIDHQGVENWRVLKNQPDPLLHKPGYSVVILIVHPLFIDIINYELYSWSRWGF